ncbi:hypothetical protein SDC9_152898 [bioreactor metagenome]|uniref:Uncharacterized protein n=1 Tax=bioreactor metagenome TaxID=1076179 RepID=A0A645EUW9_9ZZZZ
MGSIYLNEITIIRHVVVTVAHTLVKYMDSVVAFSIIVYVDGITCLGSAAVSAHGIGTHVKCISIVFASFQIVVNCDCTIIGSSVVFVRCVIFIIEVDCTTVQS